MRKSFCLAAAIAASSLAAASSFAQMPGASQGGMNPALNKLFGSHTAFSAKSDMRVLDKNQKETMSLAMDFAMLDGRMRMDIDATKMAGSSLPAEAVAQIKQMGMDRVVTVVRPDKKAMFLIYPGLKSYVNMPLSKEDSEALEKDPKIEKTSLGKETVDGHACEKFKVTLTNAKGDKFEATVWNAADLKDFPVRIETREQDNTVLMRYSQVQLTKPDAKQFDTPAGFTGYDDVQSLMAAAAKKMMPGAK